MVFGYLIQNSATEAMGYGYAFEASSFGMLIIGILFWIGVRPAKRSHTTIKSDYVQS